MEVAERSLFARVGWRGVFTQGRAAEALATCHQDPFARPNALSAHLRA